MISPLNAILIERFRYFPYKIIKDLSQEHELSNKIALATPTRLVNIDSSILKKTKLSAPIDHSGRSYEKHKKDIYNTIISKSKKNNTNDSKIAAELFVNQMPKDLSDMAAKNCLDLITKLSGVPASLFDPNASLEDTQSRLEYLMKLQIITNTINVEKEILAQIDETKIYSWQIEKEFKIEYEQIMTKDERRKVEPSSITDKYIASYSCYFETIVDKRTYQILKTIEPILKRKEIEIEYIKMTSIQNLLKQIEEKNLIGRFINSIRMFMLGIIRG